MTLDRELAIEQLAGRAQTTLRELYGLDARWMPAIRDDDREPAERTIEVDDAIVDELATPVIEIRLFALDDAEIMLARVRWELGRNRVHLWPGDAGAIPGDEPAIAELTRPRWPSIESWMLDDPHAAGREIAREISKAVDRWSMLSGQQIQRWRDR